MHLLYSAALALALVLGLPFWLLQMARKGKYRAGLAERLGRVPHRLRPTGANENCVWIHAVSVGEVLAVTGLVAEFKRKFPDWRVAVSTTTLTGQTLARAKFGDGNVFYLPLDLRLFLRPFFRHLRPRLLVLAESEFWMNLLAVARASGARVAVVNARISDRSLPRYRRIRGVMSRHIFSAIDVVLAQSPLDAERLREIGAPADRLQVSGNLKFEWQPPMDDSFAQTLRTALTPGARVVVFGSTVEGEEELLLPALQRITQQSGAVAVLAPRHPERFDAVATLLAAAGLNVVRRSAWSGRTIANGTVLLLDSIGELAQVYALCAVAFVGGSLLARGGHNVLEPAYYGKAIVVGPHTENFRDIMQRFMAQQAIVVTDDRQIADVMVALFADEARRKQLGERAQGVMNENAGATAATLSALEVLLWMPATLRERMATAEGRER